jgi:predicted nucleic acid-binding protein
VLLVDTNILFAAVDTSTPEHTRCAEVLDDHTELAVTAPVAIETAWMIESRLGPAAEGAFVGSIAASELAVIDLTAENWARCVELIGRYADLGLGLVDASVIAIAERLGVTTIATLNRRDFAVVRPAHCDALDLIP